MKLKHSMMFFEGEGAPGGGGSPAAVEPPSGSLISDGAPPAAKADATPWVGADGAFADGWTQRLPEDLGDYRESLGKFKNVGDMAKSYRELESRLGVKGTHIPGKDAKPEEVAAFRKAMGIPEAANGYNIKPEQMPDGITWPADEVLAPILEAAHKHHIPEAALRDLITSNFAAQQAATEAMAKEQLESGQAILREKWGADYDANVKLAVQAAQLAGVKPTAAGFTDPETVMAFVNLAKKIGNDQFVTANGGTGGGKGGPAEAKDIMTNPDNPKYKLYQEGDADTVSHVRRLLGQK